MMLHKNYIVETAKINVMLLLISVIGLIVVIKNLFSRNYKQRFKIVVDFKWYSTWYFSRNEAICRSFSLIFNSKIFLRLKINLETCYEMYYLIHNRILQKYVMFDINWLLFFRKKQRSQSSLHRSHGGSASSRFLSPIQSTILSIGGYGFRLVLKSTRIAYIHIVSRKSGTESIVVKYLLRYLLSWKSW